MDIKVREITDIEAKSVQEVEQALLKKHEEQFNDPAEVTIVDDANEEVEAGVEAGVAAEPTSSEMREEDIVSFINNKYGREINSIEELTAAREETEELPEDVAAYFKYKKETGRNIEDFVKLNRDIDSMNPDRLLKDYLTRTEKGLDEEDIDSLMEDYTYDEDYDEASDIKKIKLKKKKDIAKAKDYFESEKEKYRVPLESSGSSISEEDTKALAEYKQYVQQASTYEEEAKRKSNWFSQKTNEVFGGEFKGFEFSVDEDKRVTFSPGDTNEMKSMQENPQNFINKFLDDDGLLTDAVGYHKSLAVAMNPEKFAKFFYEQGKSEAVDDVMRKTKNVNMSERRAPEVTSKGGTQIRAINPDSGKGLKIRSRKK
jgi:hypothetical protein